MAAQCVIGNPQHNKSGLLNQY